MERASSTKEFLNKKRNKSEEDSASVGVTEENVNEKSDASTNDFQILKSQIKILNEKIQSNRKDMSL